MSADRERDDLPAPMDAGDAAYDASGKSAEEIEQDIAETRGQLGALLDAIEHQLAPRHLLDKGVDILKDSMSGADAGSFAATLRRHPVPLALLGAGVGYMTILTAGRGARLGARVAGTVHGAGRRVSELAGQVRDRAAGMAGGTPAEPLYPGTEPADYAYARQKSGQPMGEVPEAGSVRDGLTRLFEKGPIAMGALGLVAGALMAALLSRSAAEERLVGTAGAQLRDNAAKLGRDAAARAQQVAKGTMDAAIEAADNTINDRKFTK